jgi:photosystem II Psb27 protein
MKRQIACLLSLILVLLIGLIGSSSAFADALSGEYKQDTLTVIDSMRNAINLADDSPEKAPAQAEARKLINDFTARYRRNGSLTRLSSFTTMRTALNSLAGHYSSYPNRPLPQKLKDRLEQEFKQAEIAINRGN